MQALKKHKPIIIRGVMLTSFLFGFIKGGSEF